MMGERTPKKWLNLLAAAEEALDWMADADPETDQGERAAKLRDAIRRVKGRTPEVRHHET